MATSSTVKKPTGKETEIQAELTVLRKMDYDSFIYSLKNLTGEPSIVLLDLMTKVIKLRLREMRSLRKDCELAKEDRELDCLQQLWMYSRLHMRTTGKPAETTKASVTSLAMVIIARRINDAKSWTGCLKSESLFPKLRMRRYSDTDVELSIWHCRLRMPLHS